MGSAEGLINFNRAPKEEAEKLLLSCCGSQRWAEELLRKRPFSNHDLLFQWAEKIWKNLKKEDWLEAFLHHPRIGDRFIQDKTAAKEQAGIALASEETLKTLAQANKEYEGKHKFVFLVCASGKSAEEMLTLLQRRLQNDTETELKIAMQEQAKITRLRLERLLNEHP